LGKGSARATFVVGALLSLPGASYLIGLDHIAERDAGTAETVALILAFNLIMLILLEAPLIAFAVAPDWTPGAVERFKDYLSRNSRRLGFRLALIIGVLLIVRGVIELVSCPPRRAAPRRSVPARQQPATRALESPPTGRPRDARGRCGRAAPPAGS